METFQFKIGLIKQLLAMLYTSATFGSTGSFENQTTASSLMKPHNKRCRESISSLMRSPTTIVLVRGYAKKLQLPG